MSDTDKPRSRRRIDGRSRSVSRLAVVQALYQMELAGQDSESAIAEFVEHRIGQSIDGESFAEADLKYFGSIVRGVVARQDEIDRALAAATGKSWSYDRIDAIMRAIFRACTYELLANSTIPAKVAVSEYLNVAAAFFEENGSELPFIGGVLHRIARDLRPAEVPVATTPDP
jgi:N utilization substance protein B